MPPEPVGLPELRAHRRAMENRGQVITTNLDTHYRQIMREREAQSMSESMKGAIGGSTGMVRQASSEMGKYGRTVRRAQSGVAVDRVFDVPYNPFRNRTAVETPKNDKERRARYRYYAQYDPHVGAAIDLHSEFPLSTFELQHEDKSLEREFNDIAEEINLFEFLIDLAREYWMVGEAIPFGFFDDPHDPGEWTKFILLNPDLVKIINHQMMQGKHTHEVFLQLDSVIMNIVQRGPYDPETKNAFHRLPEDVIQYARQGQPMPLAPIQVSHFKRKGSNTFGLRGESILSRVLHVLAYRDKLRDAQYTIADRHTTPKEFYFIGSDAEPADQSELDAFADLIAQSWLDPNLAIVWHHAVNVQWQGAEGRILPLRQEIDQIDRELMAALMLNKAFIYGEGPTYANSSVALEVLISRYIQFRQRLERWIRDSVAAPLCRIHSIYKPTQAELDHKIRVKGSNKKPWTPDVVWSKYELRDNYQKIQLYERLVQGGLLPRDHLYRSLNLNPAQVRSALKADRKLMMQEQQDMVPTGVPLGGPGPGAPPMAPPMPGGGAPPTDREKAEMIAPGARPVTFPETPPDVAVPGAPRQIPEESRRPVGLIP